MRGSHHCLQLPVALLCALLLTACATSPRHDDPLTQARGEGIAAQALAQLGKPYRYGGEGPDAFDCSGLVHFTHQAVGIDTPRTTVDQFHAARRIELRAIEPGDLLFFRIDSAEISHVGVYIGGGQFVHAPQSGRPVERRPLDDSYYRARLVAAGRLF